MRKVAVGWSLLRPIAARESEKARFESGRRFELLRGNPAQLEQPDQRLFDQIVRAGRAGGDADDDRPRRQPVARDDFLLLVQIVVENFLVRDQAEALRMK